MVEIQWTFEAKTWMKDIYDFIKKDNKLAARRVIDGIYEKVQILRDHPKIGQRYRLGKSENILLLLLIIIWTL